MDFGLDKIKGFPATTILSVVGGTIMPGFLFLFIFNRQFFLNTDVLLLCLLAPSITLPILILNTGVMIISLAIATEAPSNDEDRNHKFLTAVYFSNLLSSIVIYATILIGYFMSLNVKQGVITVLCIQFFALCLIVFLFRNITDDRIS